MPSGSWGILQRDDGVYRKLDKAIAGWDKLRGGKTVNKELVWFPKPSTSLTDMRGKLQVALEIQEAQRETTGEEYFGEDAVAAELARRGAITRPSVPIDQTMEEYEDEQVANRPHISSFRMQNRIFRFLGWTTRRVGFKNQYIVTRRGIQLCRFSGPFPGRIGTLSELEFVAESLLSASVFSVNDAINQWDTRFKQRIVVSLLTCAARFGYISNNELITTAFALRDERESTEVSAMLARLQRLHDGRLLMAEAFEEVGVDPNERSAVTGAYDGPKVLTSLCRQCGLLESSTKPLSGMELPIQELYSNMHKGKSQVMVPRVVNLISDRGRQAVAEESSKELVRFEDLRD